MQLLNGNDGQSGAASYGVNIETDYNSTTTHSTFITVTPGGTYWYSLKADFAAGEAYLNIYSTTGTLVGSTTVQTRATGTAAFIEYGNNEAGTSPGTTTYFGDSLLAYTNPVFPLGPGGSNNVAYGDVNGALNNSGQPVVNINDAEMTAQETIGLNVPNFISANAEVDGTKTVDIYDAFLIAEYAIGLITKFPVQG
jgi:flagellar hook assembly protein FlgD